MKTYHQPISALKLEVHSALKKVIDRETGENIIDLGLIYGLEVNSNTAHAL